MPACILPCCARHPSPPPLFVSAVTRQKPSALPTTSSRSSPPISTRPQHGTSATIRTQALAWLPQASSPGIHSQQPGWRTCPLAQTRSSCDKRNHIHPCNMRTRARVCLFPGQYNIDFGRVVWGQCTYTQRELISSSCRPWPSSPLLSSRLRPVQEGEE